jgi:predicted acetyltransferase
MDIEIRSIESAEIDDWARAVGLAFSERPREEWLEVERKLIEPERTFAAIDEAQFVGGASTNSMRMTVPGDEIPIAGVTGVGVSPTHRRRGVASALMRHQIDHVRERGQESIAALYASEGGIYGRYGFGISTLTCSMQIERDRTTFQWLPHEPGRVHLLEWDQARSAIELVYDAVRIGQPGMVERRGFWWDGRFSDFEQDRDGASAYFFAVHEGADGVDAYAVYRFKHEWSDSVPHGVVEVEELIAITPEAYANMWRYVFDIDLAERIKCDLRPVDDPLLSLLVEPRRLRLTVKDGIWLRLIDVREALCARRYAVPGSVVFEVRDPFCPWNEDRYVLEGGPDGAECRATDAEPDLVLSSTELAAAYLGGLRFGQLARAGRVHGAPGDTLRRVDSMFSWDPAPWCSELF